MTQEEIEVFAQFVKVARYIRNFPNPQLTIEYLRSEAVRAEVLAEDLLGEKQYSMVCKKAFN